MLNETNKSNTLLKINGLRANVGEKTILNGLDLEIGKGEVHLIMGPNGAGKSTLANVIMGHPSYEVTDGEILFEGENIVNEKTDVRAKKGIFLSFQHPEEIDGITVENFLRTAKSAITGEQIKAFTFHKELKEKMKDLNFDESYSKRYVNVGFSGGERKKNEIFQLLMLNPKLAILDETDSGLDVDAVKAVCSGINQYRNEQNSILMITHNPRILENVRPDFVHILYGGKIVKTGDYTLAEHIGQNGFSGVLEG